MGRQDLPGTFWECVYIAVFMKDERPLKMSRPSNRRRLEERLAQRPELLERMHEMVDRLEQTVGDGSDAHQAEDRVVQEMRKLGHSVLEQWAQEANQRIQDQVPNRHPRAQKHGKKNS